MIAYFPREFSITAMYCQRHHVADALRSSPRPSKGGAGSAPVFGNHFSPHERQAGGNAIICDDIVQSD